MAFDTSVSGILAASADLGIIGNNIANASTVGFKTSRGEFTDIYAASLLGTPGTSVGQGVKLNSVTQDFSQGNIQFTSNSLDLAINGPGFFRLSNDGVATYTRAGAFQLDREGNIVNSSGMKLQGFPQDRFGNITGELGDLVLSTALIDPQATTQVSISANLDSREVAPAAAFAALDADGNNTFFDAFANPPTSPDSDMFNASSSMTIYDGLGNPHVLSVYFAKRNPGDVELTEEQIAAGESVNNRWYAYTLIDGVQQGEAQEVSFGSDGLLELDPNDPLKNKIQITDWQPLDSNGEPLGASAQTFTVDYESFTQYGTDFSISSVVQDGYSTGQLRGIEIDSSGIMFTRYTNGQSRTIGQIAIASFTNQNGLQPAGDTTFVETFSSGQATITTPGLGGTGLLSSGALEGSNVELTQQLVNMIVAQRNFQANAQMIQTEDAVTQSVINLR